jgi:hypothetical protein
MPSRRSLIMAHATSRPRLSATVRS